MREPHLFGTDLSRPPRPWRGMGLSILAHGFFLLLTLVVPWSYWIPSGPHLVAEQTQLREQALLLPRLQPKGGGRPAASAPGGGRGQIRRHPRPAPANHAKATRGVVYKGPQLIVSNPRRPDNYIQTIRQPDLIKPPVLPAALPIPPIIAMKAAAPALKRPVKPAPAPKPPKPVPVLPLGVSRELAKVEAPKLPLPAAPPQSPLASVAKPSAQAPVPKFAPSAVALDTESAGAQNVLVVDALPVQQTKPVEIPPGELHGSFTVSPIGTATVGLAGGGPAAAGSPGDASGTVGGPYAGAGVAPEGASGAGSGAGNGPATGNVAGLGSGNGAGNGNGSTSTGSGTGTGTLAGKGSGKGRGSGGGSGGGTGSGSSPFPKIMIQGGDSPGGSGHSSFGISFGPQTRPSYGITIVANGSSGGGFPDYGVFRDVTSYTVYLDMSDTGLPGQNWPMQYALEKSTGPGVDPPPGAPMLAPYPVVKELPHFDPAVARRDRGGSVVVLGVIDQSGGWKSLRVMHSPDRSLNQPVLQALAHWTFKPAKMSGTPVKVKCLLGVKVMVYPKQ